MLYSPLSSSDRPFFQQGLNRWSSVANINFVEVIESAMVVGDIRAAYTYQFSKDDFAAWAYFPASAPKAGDIWFNALNSAGTDVWTPGSYANFTMLHELGHALGLKHPFEYPAVPSGWDTQSFTVMSYSSILGAPGTSSFSYYPTSPMMLDILALQHLYGFKHRNTGDNTYVYSDRETYHETLYDTGGNDTIRYDGFRGSTIDLNSGQGSEIGTPVFMSSMSGSRQQVKNVWMARDVYIENAIGGGGADRLIGNERDNILAGRGGNDSIVGGLGFDTAVYSGRISQYEISRTTVRDKTGADGADSISGIERIYFTDKNVDLGVSSLSKRVAPETLKSIVELYTAFFNRVPDGEGMAFWLGQAVSGVSIPTIANSFYGAALQYSGLTGYSAGMTSADFVGVVYRNVLGRATIDVEGLNYWTRALSQGTETRGSLVKTILDSAHTFKGRSDFGHVADLLDNKYLVGKWFAVDLGLSFNTPESSISEGMRIASAVTSTDTAVAISLIGVLPTEVQIG